MAKRDKAGTDVDKDGIDDSVDTEITLVPIEPGKIPNCNKCNDTGSVPKRTHLDDNDNVVVDEYKDCSCGIVQREREEAKKFKANG